MGSGIGVLVGSGAGGLVGSGIGALVGSGAGGLVGSDVGGFVGSGVGVAPPSPMIKSNSLLISGLNFERTVSVTCPSR